MMIKKCLIFLKVVVLLSCLNATAIAAQDLNSPVLNFSEFLQLVETHNHELKIKKMYLELNKQGVNIANSKYDPKFNLRGRLNHNAAKMHAEDTGSVWRVDNSYSYGLDVFSKRFKSGGTLGLGLERVENKTDFSQTVGTDYQSTESKVLLSFRQPLLKGFIGLDSVEYSLYRQKLRYEQDELVFIQFKNDLLYTAVLAYLDYSGDVQEKEIKKKSIQYLSELIEEVEKVSSSEQLKFDLVNLKILLNEKIDQVYLLEGGIIEKRYTLLNLINDPERSALNFGLFPKNTETSLEEGRDSLVKLNNKESLFLKHENIEIDLQELSLKRQKNENLPDLDLNASVNYRASESSSPSTSSSFEDPTYNLGLTFLIPIGDRELSFLEDAEKIALDLTKLSLKQTKNWVENETKSLLEQLEIYKKRTAALKTLVALHEKKVDLEINRFKANLSNNPSHLDLYLNKTSNVKTTLENFEKYNDSHIENVSSYFATYYALKYAQVRGNQGRRIQSSF